MDENGLEKFPALVEFIEVTNVNVVKHSIEIGKRLIEINFVFKGMRQWLDFINKNFYMNLHSCQKYMVLAQTSIHENHFKMGVDELLEKIEEGYDLSSVVLNFHCQGCTAYNQIDNENKEDGCLSILNNQQGDCPCSICKDRSKCPDLCGDWYGWQESLK